VGRTVGGLEVAVPEVCLMVVPMLLPRGAIVTAPPSATVKTSLVLSWSFNILPVDVELLAIKVSLEPEVRLVTVVGPVIAVVPAIDDPMLMLVVEEAVELLPRLIVWVAEVVVFPMVTVLALAVPMDTVPVVPVEVPTSIETLPEAKAPEVTLPEAMVMLEVAAPALLVVETVRPLSPCRVKAPLVVDKEEAALPCRLTAPPLVVMPALPVIKLEKVLAPASV
jgi:hypothetical protein